MNIKSNKEGVRKSNQTTATAPSEEGVFFLLISSVELGSVSSYRLSTGPALELKKLRFQAHLWRRKDPFLQPVSGLNIFFEEIFFLFGSLLFYRWISSFKDLAQSRFELWIWSRCPVAKGAKRQPRLYHNCRWWPSTYVIGFVDLIYDGCCRHLIRWRSPGKVGFESTAGYVPLERISGDLVTTAVIKIW